MIFLPMHASEFGLHCSEQMYFSDCMDHDDQKQETFTNAYIQFLL